jgi:hypothetical protein
MSIAGYISLIILYCLIVVYAVLSQSIWSAIDVMFLIASLIANIARPAHLALKNKTDTVFEWTKVVPYNTDRVLLILFLALNIAFIIAKIVIYFTSAA